MSDTSLYEKMGGKVGIESLTLDFYARVVKDPTLAPFFRHTSFEKLYVMQQEFFSMALGGPIEYAGQALGKVHHGRGILPVHVVRFMEHLLATLKAKGADDTDVREIIDRVSLHANEIVGLS